MEVGNKVILMEGWLHYMNEKVYPIYGTQGTVVRVGVDREENTENIVMMVGSGDMVEVQWDGSDKKTLVFESQLQFASLPMPENKFGIGDTVRFIADDQHKQYPQFYPPVGTKGKIDNICAGDEYGIRWKKGTTSGNDTWLATGRMIELVKKAGDPIWRRKN